MRKSKIKILSFLLAVLMVCSGILPGADMSGMLVRAEAEDVTPETRTPNKGFGFSDEGFVEVEYEEVDYSVASDVTWGADHDINTWVANAIVYNGVFHNPSNMRDKSCGDYCLFSLGVISIQIKNIKNSETAKEASTYFHRTAGILKVNLTENQLKNQDKTWSNVCLNLKIAAGYSTTAFSCKAYVVQNLGDKYTDYRQVCYNDFVGGDKQQYTMETSMAAYAKGDVVRVDITALIEQVAKAYIDAGETGDKTIAIAIQPTTDEKACYSSSGRDNARYTPVVQFLKEKEPVAKIGETPYYTLGEAIDKATTSDTITLLKDIDVTGTEGEKIQTAGIVDLAGNTLTADSFWGNIIDTGTDSDKPGVLQVDKNQLKILSSTSSWVPLFNSNKQGYVFTKITEHRSQGPSADTNVEGKYKFKFRSYFEKFSDLLRTAPGDSNIKIGVQVTGVNTDDTPLNFYADDTCVKQVYTNENSALVLYLSGVDLSKYPNITIAPMVLFNGVQWWTGEAQSFSNSEGGSE